jgi:hypothetical protein
VGEVAELELGQLGTIFGGLNKSPKIQVLQVIQFIIIALIKAIS